MNNQIQIPIPVQITDGCSETGRELCDSPILAYLFEIEIARVLEYQISLFQNGSLAPLFAVSTRDRCGKIAVHEIP